MAIQKYDIPRSAGGFKERRWQPPNIPVLGADGEVRYIIHQVEDVTAEVRERQRAAEAEADAARCRELADAIPGLVFEADAAGRNIYVNEQYCSYTGLGLEALLGEGWRQVIHPDDRDRTMEDAALRVYAVAKVHDQLWRQADPREIDVASADAPASSPVCSLGRGRLLIGRPNFKQRSDHVH